jgi:hypothetical protein
MRSAAASEEQPVLDRARVMLRAARGACLIEKGAACAAPLIKSLCRAFLEAAANEAGCCRLRHLTR